MPRYAIQAPDGKTYQIDGPPGATDDQVRAEVMRQYPHLASAPPPKAAPAPASVSDPTGYMKGIGETALSLGTGFLGQLAGGARGLLNPGERWKDKAARNAALAESITYSPRSNEGKAVSEAAGKVLAIPAEVGNRIQDDATRAGHPGVGAGVNIAMQLAPAVIGAAAGLKGGKPEPAPRGATPRTGPGFPRKSAADLPPIQVKESGVLEKTKDRFTKGGARNIASRVERDVAGPVSDRLALIDALRNAEGPVKDFQPTAGQATAHIPEGSPIQALQDSVASQTGARQGGPSTRFGIRREGQDTAIENAKIIRGDVTKPMREAALKVANDTTARFNMLGDKIEKRFTQLASLAETEKSAMGIRATSGVMKDNYFPVKGMPRVPGRITPHDARIGEANATLSEVRPMIEKAKTELQLAQKYLAQSNDPVTTAKAEARIAEIMKTPGLRASLTVEKAMKLVNERLQSLAERNGTVAAEDLYMIRKELGSYIEQASKESANWDKKLTAGLQRDLQMALDDSIEAASGNNGMWRTYLREYSQRSKKIDMAKDMQERAKSPLQRSTIGPADHVENQTATGLPNILDRKAMIANAILKSAGKGKAADVTRLITEDMLTPEKLAAALEGKVPTLPPRTRPTSSGPSTRAAVGAAAATNNKKNKK